MSTTMSTDNTTTNATVDWDLKDVFKPTEVEHIIGVILIVVLFIFGVIGNGLVLKGSKRVTFFAKRNAYLFFGLALGDALVCLLRGFSLLFVSFPNTVESKKIACWIWTVSNIFVFIAILTNTILAIERRMIIVSFQRYLVLFTTSKVLVANIVLWCFITVVSVAIFVALHREVRFDAEFQMCSFSHSHIREYLMIPDVVATVFSSAFGLLPILIIACSYSSIIFRIVRTDLLKIDGLVDNALYSRLVNVSAVRVLLTIITWPPFLVFVAIFPIVPRTTWYIRYARFADYLILAQSSISPFITLHDTDFRETSANRRLRFCSTLRTQTSDAKSFKRKSTKGSTNGGYINSGDFPTIGQAN